MAAAAALGIGLIHLAARIWTVPDEPLRKMVHTLVGVLTLTFPWVFDAAWPVVVIAAAVSAAMWALRTVPAFHAWVLRLGFGRALRLESLGDVVHPLTLALVFVLGRRTPIPYVAAVLVITFADAAAAVIGRAHGRLRYRDLGGTAKSVEGSLACFGTAWVCVAAPVWLSGLDPDPVRASAAACAIALLVAMLEGMSWRGLDNLFVPLPVLYLVRWCPGLDRSVVIAAAGTSAAAALGLLLIRRTGPSAR